MILVLRSHAFPGSPIAKPYNRRLISAGQARLLRARRDLSAESAPGEEKAERDNKEANRGTSGLAGIWMRTLGFSRLWAIDQESQIKHVKTAGFR